MKRLLVYGVLAVCVVLSLLIAFPGPRGPSTDDTLLITGLFVLMFLAILLTLSFWAWSIFRRSHQGHPSFLGWLLTRSGWVVGVLMLLGILKALMRQGAQGIGTWAWVSLLLLLAGLGVALTLTGNAITRAAARKKGIAFDPTKDEPPPHLH
jgi:hypothetical protein